MKASSEDQGVVDAWAITKKARSEYPNHKIFMIGWLVHCFN